MIDKEAAWEARLLRYVERVFAASGNTKWPTVRDAARALKVRQSFIQEIVEGSGGFMSSDGTDGKMMLTSFLTVRPEPLGDHYIEIM